jgi:hypothetical protein
MNLVGLQFTRLQNLEEILLEILVMGELGLPILLLRLRHKDLLILHHRIIDLPHRQLLAVGLLLLLVEMFVLVKINLLLI